MGQAKQRGALSDRIEESLYGVRALNYSAHAIADLEAVARQHDQVGNLYHLQSVLALRWVIQQLRGGEKFIMPQNALLLNVKGMKEGYSYLLRLPYPTTVLEFPTSVESNGGSTKCIVLATTDHDWIDPAYLESEYAADGINDIISFTLIYWSKAQSVWLPIPYLFWFHRDHIVIHNECGHRGGASGFHWKLLYPSLFEGVLQQLSDEEQEEESFRNFSVGMDALIEFCLTVNCENVQQFILPPPAALNKRRAERGHEPFDSYRVLTIPGSDASGEAGSGTGTLASPRLHLRRGHLRRLASGKVTWVRHTIVGDVNRGVVDKTYSVVKPN